jgi:NHLM bacteriocin system ABC transporter peptidase/ATP-binding protein
MQENKNRRSLFQYFLIAYRLTCKAFCHFFYDLFRSTRTPLIIQMEIAECGAAALAIVLAYYGKHIPLAEARQECGVSRDGSKAIYMLKAARHYGLKAQGAQVHNIEDLSYLKMPLIVHWQFNHFVVLEEIRGDNVYVNDPAIGRRRLTKKEFSSGFTGIILLLEPSDDFQPVGQSFSSYKALKERFQHSSTALIFIVLATLALTLMGMMGPGFMKIFVDDILIAERHTWFIPLIVGLAAITFLEAILLWVQQTHLVRLQLNMMVKQSARFLWHVLHLPILFFAQRFAGDIQARMAANDRIADLLSGQLSSSIVSFLTLILYIILMFFLNVSLTIVVVCVGFLNMLLLYLIGEKMSDMNYQLLQEQGKLSGLSMNGLHIIETLKATGTEDGFFLNWTGLHAKTINSQQKIMFYNQILLIGPALITGLTTVTILGWGSWQIIQGDLTIGTLLAFQMLAALFYVPLNILLGMAGQIQQIRGDLLRLTDIQHHPLDKMLAQRQESDVSSAVAKLNGKVTLQDVTFGYSPMEPPLIKKLNLEILPGQRVAIVGATGSGKSTIAKLILSLYSPWSGQILFDDQPIETLPREVLKHSLALVDQDLFLYEGTTRANLTLWNPEIQDRSIFEALKDAAIEEEVFIHGGLDHDMNENGSNYSGGERQRLEIARALAINPSILVLDEATSALDSITEKTIYQNLKQRNCTLIIISHRVSTIRDSDHILVLDKGEIVEHGTHDTLMSKESRYKTLMKLELVS